MMDDNVIELRLVCMKHITLNWLQLFHRWYIFYTLFLLSGIIHYFNQHVTQSGMKPKHLLFDS